MKKSHFHANGRVVTSNGRAILQKSAEILQKYLYFKNVCFKLSFGLPFASNTKSHSKSYQQFFNPGGEPAAGVLHQVPVQGEVCTLVVVTRAALVVWARLQVLDSETLQKKHLWSSCLDSKRQLGVNDSSRHCCDRLERGSDESVCQHLYIFSRIFRNRRRFLGDY